MQERSLQSVTLHQIAVRSICNTVEIAQSFLYAASIITACSRFVRCTSTVHYRRCRCDLQLGACLRSARTKIANVIGRTFFNVAGMSCFKYDYPIKRCAKFYRPPKNRYTTACHFFRIWDKSVIHLRLPPWVLSVTRVKEDPEKPRCQAYEYDYTKPKMWQFFETVYEETNNWMLIDNRPEWAQDRRKKSLPFFQVSKYVE